MFPSDLSLLIRPQSFCFGSVSFRVFMVTSDQGNRGNRGNQGIVKELISVVEIREKSGNSMKVWKNQGI